MRADRWARPALGLAVFGVSFAALFFRLARPTHPLIMAATRLSIAAIVLVIPTLLAWRAGRLPRRLLVHGLVCGLFYAIHFGTWVSSLELTSVAASVTLVTATPLVLAIVALATGRDRPEPRHWISIALAAIGLGLIGWRDLSGPAGLGDALALVGAVAMAGYLLTARRLGADLHAPALAGIATAVGAAVLWASALALRVPIAYASTQSILWIALCALIPRLLGHTLLTWSLRHSTPTAVGLATIGEPALATLWAWVFLHERVDLGVASGCAITLAAVALSLRRS